MKLSFKKRIALFNTLAVAATTAIVFIIVYAVVYLSSYRHLDSDITVAALLGDRQIDLDIFRAGGKTRNQFAAAINHVHR